MRRMLANVACGVMLACNGRAQNSAQYEVASIRPAPANHPNGIGASGGPGTADPTHVRYGYFPLRLLLMTAFDISVHQISLPARLESAERYDIVANVPPGTSKGQSLVMLQNFLIDRFHLKLHRETRVVPHYELTIARNGPRLEAHPGGADRADWQTLPGGQIGVRLMGDRNHMHARRVHMKQLVQVLSDDLATPVLDKTGLTGEYDFDFEYSREGLHGFRRPLTDGPEVSNASTIQVALEEKLGLKLERKRGPVEMLVVDSGERAPAEN